MELCTKLEQGQKSRTDVENQLKAELAQLRIRCEENSRSHEEQLHVHSQTICALEERLDKSMNKNRELIVEISSLKAANSGMRFMHHCNFNCFKTSFKFVIICMYCNPVFYKY